MNSSQFIRLKIAGLYLVSFIGLLLHVLMGTFDMVVSLMKAIVSMNPVGSVVDADIIRHLADAAKEFGEPSIPIMMFVFIIISLATVIIPLMTEARIFRWMTVVLGALLAIMNGMDGAVHIFKEGEVVNGLYPLLISCGVGIAATAISFKWTQCRTEQ